MHGVKSYDLLNLGNVSSSIVRFLSEGTVINKFVAGYPTYCNSSIR